MASRAWGWRWAQSSWRARTSRALRGTSAAGRTIPLKFCHAICWTQWLKRLRVEQDQQLYKQSLGAEVGAPEQLTRVDEHRFADAAVDEQRGRLLAVREDHTGAGEAVNTVAAVCVPDTSPQPCSPSMCARRAWLPCRIHALCIRVKIAVITRPVWNTCKVECLNGTIASQRARGNAL